MAVSALTGDEYLNWLTRMETVENHSVTYNR